MAEDATVEISTVNTAASEFRAAAVVVPAVPAPAVPGPAPVASFHDHVSEFAANVAGSLSPFGDDVEFPLPADHLSYQHPGPANRPALAGD